jgi:cell division protein ZapD
MRLEFLFQQVDFSLEASTEWHSRATMAGILEIQNLLGRSDLKTEVLKELERHTASLAKLEKNPGVDRGRLGQILDELDSLIDLLYANNQQIGYELKENEFLSSILQRITVPGGTCGFDLPGYHYWLQRPAEQRLRELHQWYGSFTMLRKAIDLILLLIRQSAVARMDIAEGGFYQKNMDANNPCQILRVTLPSGVSYFPEISGGKHRFTIRFMHNTDYDIRPKQIEQDVHFEMACCMI